MKEREGVAAAHAVSIKEIANFGIQLDLFTFQLTVKSDVELHGELVPQKPSSLKNFC